jgi:hypothetical protein
MKQEIADLKKGNVAPVTVKAVDTALDSKYGPGANVSTKIGKLQIGGLIQVWYYAIQNDSHGFFHDPANSGVIDNNLTQDINSFRIRRTELKFTVDINECVSGVVMFDPAREAAGFPAFPSNQGLIKRTAVAANSANISAGGFAAVTGPPRLLQDAYVNYHCCIPHHDVQIGQFKPWVGEEGIRSSSELDFAERSILGQFADSRDLGASIHGSWWGKDCNDRDGRFQYWLGVFDNASSYYVAGVSQNRSDNNQSKDINARLLVRPIWGECAGNLEVGGSYEGGVHGQMEDPSLYPAVTATTPILPQVWASRWNGWVYYKAGKLFAKGLWIRSEFNWTKDRAEAPGIAFGNGNLGTGATLGLTQSPLRAFSSQGFYAAAGYRFGEASWVDCMPCALKPVEVLARYEMYDNIHAANITDATRTDSYTTRVATAGINYYFVGNTKIQLNYNWVELPSDHTNLVRKFHDTRNNSLVVNFQVAF